MPIASLLCLFQTLMASLLCLFLISFRVVGSLVLVFVVSCVVVVLVLCIKNRDCRKRQSRSLLQFVIECIVYMRWFDVCRPDLIVQVNNVLGSYALCLRVAIFIFVFDNVCPISFHSLPPLVKANVSREHCVLD